MEDFEIVNLYWARSEDAIVRTAEKYGGYCRAIACRILSSQEDAQESVNDTYLAAWNAMPPHRPAALQIFLGKITRRLSLKKWRDQTRQKRGGGQTALVLDELAESLPDKSGVEDQILGDELVRALNGFLEDLPETNRRVFLRRYWYFDSIDEISQDFGFSPSKVKSMLHRTREKLRSFLVEEGWK